MSGRGRMWNEVLTRLSREFDIRSVRVPGTESLGERLRRRPEAWLFDGHNGPLPVRQPQVIQLHEAPWNELDTMATLEARFVEKVVGPSRLAAQAASAVVCPSESSKRQIVADCGISAERVFVAHHGVDHTVFQPGLSGGAAVASSFGADSRHPYVLTVASLHPRKNLLALREAIGQLAGEGFPHQLVIVGGPAHGRDDNDDLSAATFAELPGYPGRLVSVPFGINDRDLASLMGGAAAFCLPSLSEGFGLPAAEAMACGVATVLSDRGALTEVGGDAAILVEPSADGITDGLRSLLSDSGVARSVGSACAIRAKQFSWDRCATEWAAAIVAGIAMGMPSV
jgi:glycosyltransferase involved in cell wall biosynthesis